MWLPLPQNQYAEVSVKKSLGAGEMAQWGKALDAYTDGLGSVLGTLMVEGKTDCQKLPLISVPML